MNLSKNTLKHAFFTLVSFCLVTTNIFAVRGAGGLPFARDPQGRIVFLLGREGSGEWCDFGGKYELKDGQVINNCPPIQTAAREFSEETKNVFGNGREAASMALFISQVKAGPLNNPVMKTYDLYLVQVPFIDANVFKHARGGHDADKTDYTWVDAHAFLAAIEAGQYQFAGKNMRPHIADIIRANAQIIRQIIGASATGAAQATPLPTAATRHKPAQPQSSTRAPQPSTSTTPLHRPQAVDSDDEDEDAALAKAITESLKPQNQTRPTPRPTPSSSSTPAHHPRAAAAAAAPTIISGIIPWAQRVDQDGTRPVLLLGRNKASKQWEFFGKNTADLDVSAAQAFEETKNKLIVESWLDQESPTATGSGYSIRFLQVRFIRARDITGDPSPSIFDDFVWVNVSDVLQGADILYCGRATNITITAKTMSGGTKSVTLSRELATMLSENISVLLQINYKTR